MHCTYYTSRHPLHPIQAGLSATRAHARGELRSTHRRTCIACVLCVFASISPPPLTLDPPPTHRLDPPPQELVAVEDAGPVEGHVRPSERPSPAGHQEAVRREGHAGERRLDVPVHAVDGGGSGGGGRGGVVIRYVVPIRKRVSLGGSLTDEGSSRCFARNVPSLGKASYGYRGQQDAAAHKHKARD